MKNIALIGSTGSIGVQTLEVIRAHPNRFRVVAIGAGNNVDLLIEQIKEFEPTVVSVAKKEDVKKITDVFGSRVKVYYGEEGLCEVAVHKDATFFMNAVVGSLGLLPTLAAIKEGKDIGIANKETLVTAGHIVTSLAEENNVRLLPVDSEHSAIFQSLQGNRKEDVERLILTASGGSFRDRTREELVGVTVEEALNHPNWEMGAKITIDSATMMNKGLEVIEAHWLFDIPFEQIDVVIHKESIIHSLVEYRDKSVIAQLGTPNMKLPIAYALSYPERLEFKQEKALNLWEIGSLHFEKPDVERFRSLQFAYEAGRIGGTMPTALNAANEEATKHFLEGNIEFLAIEDHIEKALERHDVIHHPSLEQILEVDKETRAFVRSRIE